MVHRLTAESSSSRLRVSAIILAHNRCAAVVRGIDRLREEGVDEIVVVDNASDDGTADAVRRIGGNVRVVACAENIGVAGRNRGAEAANGDLLLLVDDDSYPLPGAVDILTAPFVTSPRLGVLGGFIQDRDKAGKRIADGAIGTFDWWLRAGAEGDAPPQGFPSTYFPECGCVIRREAYFDAGGFYEPFFFHISEPDFAIRMLARGWDVRYQPAARFEHAKSPRDHAYVARNLRFRVRNQLWHYWLRYPAGVALSRAALHAFLDLLECTWSRCPGAWAGGVADGWRLRASVRGDRAPIPRELVGRAELGRIGMQLRFASWMGRNRVLPALFGRIAGRARRPAAP